MSKAFLIACLFLTLPCSAAVFKCTDSKGVVTYRDQKCPTSDAGGEISVRGAAPTPSGEDQAWVEQKKKELLANCNKILQTQDARKTFSLDESRKVCDCTTTKLFQTSLPKLKAIEKAGDTKGAEQLIAPIMMTCMADAMSSRAR